jgi:hypothetical protein
VAPISKTNSRLFTTMADTWEAFARDEEALRQFISKQPATMDAGISSFRVQRPFLHDLALFSEDFSGATQELRGALPDINPALETGTRVQRRVPALNERLEDTFDALQDLTAPPSTNAAVRAIGGTVTTLNPQLRFYGPYVTVCNAPNYFFTYLAEHFSESDSSGESQRALANFAGQQDDSLGAMGADAPANGNEVKQGNKQYLHGDPYGAAITPSGQADCEAGQRGYVENNARFYDDHYKIDQDARTPGAQGTTYTGRPSVPKGETYTAIPETGAYSKIPPSTSGER